MELGLVPAGRFLDHGGALENAQAVNRGGRGAEARVPHTLRGSVHQVGALGV